MNYLKKNDKIFFDSVILLKFRKTKVAKEKFYPTKTTINIWDINIDSIVKKDEIKNSSKYLIEYFDNNKTRNNKTKKIKKTISFIFV